MIESFRPGVVDRLGIGYDGGVGPQPAHRLLLHDRLRAGRSARAVGGPRPQLPRRRRLPRLHRAGAEGGGPPIPGAHRRRQRGRRHARGHGDPRRARAAGRRPAPARTSTSSVADGVLALMALAGRRVPRDRRRPGAAPRPPHRPLRVLRQLRRRATASGSRSPRSSRASGRTSAPRSGSSSGSAHQTDDTVQDEIRADLRAAFLTRDRDDWVAELCRRRHLRRAGALRARGRRRRAVRRRGARSWRRSTPSTARSGRSARRSRA